MSRAQDLCDEHDAWLKANDLPNISADELAVELMCERDESNDPQTITTITVQLRWLIDFIERWEHAMERKEVR